MNNHLKLLAGTVAALFLTSTVQANDALATLDCVVGDMTYSVSVNPFTSSVALVKVGVGEMMDQSLNRDFALNKIDPPAGAVIAYGGVDKIDGQVTMTTDSNQNTKLKLGNYSYDCAVSEFMGEAPTQEPTWQERHEADRIKSEKMERVSYMNETGYSLGGKMRSRPDKSFDKVAKVSKGNRVEIIGKTLMENDGYTWYKVRAGNRSGFMWGGDLCSAYGRIDGVYGDCRNQGIDVENMWMVIASDAASRGGYGIAVDRREAQRKAMRDCKKSSCKIINEGQPLCHAYAASRKDGYYDGLAMGHDIYQVRRDAKNNCESYASSKGSCKVKFAMCQNDLKPYQR